MHIQEALGHLLEGRSLDAPGMTRVMQQIMTGEATDAQIGAVLAALRMKGETVEEVAAAATVMRALATSVDTGAGVSGGHGQDAVDIVGTGGDTTHTFNISTCSALVAAAAGVRVAKHGNRSVSSKSGAADLLEAAGVNIELDADQVRHCIEQVNIGFMFAPRHHSAMKHAIGPRREMGVRTLFNLLGPLTNPAAAANQLMGVYAEHWVRPMAEVLQVLGSRHVMVVHGVDGMDEISPCGPTRVAELHDGAIRDYTIEPGQFGLPLHELAAIQVDGAEQSLAMIRSVLADESGAARDVVLLNAGAAIRVAGAAESLDAGIEKAASALASGAAADTLARLIDVSQSFGKAETTA